MTFKPWKSHVGLGTKLKVCRGLTQNDHMWVFLEEKTPQTKQGHGNRNAPLNNLALQWQHIPRIPILYPALAWILNNPKLPCFIYYFYLFILLQETLDMQTCQGDREGNINGTKSELAHWGCIAVATVAILRIPVPRSPVLEHGSLCTVFSGKHLGISIKQSNNPLCE